MSIIPSRQRDLWRRALAPVLFVAFTVLYLQAPSPRVPSGESLRLLACAEGWESWRGGDSPLWIALARLALALPLGSPVERLIMISALAAAGAAALVFLMIGNYIHNRTPEELFHEPYPALMGLVPAAACSIAFALCRPIWDGATSVSVEPLSVLLFALLAWSLMAARVTSRLRYFFIASLVYGLGASSSRVLLFSLPLFLIFLTTGMRVRWWRGAPAYALAAGFALGITVWAVPALVGGNAFGAAAAENIRGWTFLRPDTDSAVVHVVVPDPMNPGRRMTRVTFVPASAVEDAPFGARLGGATLFFASLLPLLVVSWNWRRDIKRDRSPRDTQVGSILRRILFSVLLIGGVLFFARSDRVVAAGVGPESYITHVYLVAALWLAYCVGYWLIVLGAAPASYRRKTVPRARVLGGRVLVLGACVLLVGASAAAVFAASAAGGRGLDAHLARVAQSVGPAESAVGAADLSPVILLSRAREMQAFRAGSPAIQSAGPAPVVLTVQELADPGDRAKLAERVPLPVATGAVDGAAAAQVRSRAELESWAAARPVYTTGRLDRLLPEDAALLPCGVAYAIVPAPSLEARLRYAEKAAALWDAWWAETGGMFEATIRNDYGRFLNDAGVEIYSLGDAVVARRMFERACFLDRGNPCAWYNLGMACSVLGDPAGAAAAEGQHDALRVRFPKEADWREVVRRHGEVLSAARRVDIGSRWLDDGEPARALVSFRSALEVEPRDRHARLGVAEASLGLGNVDAARAALRPLFDADPGDPDALVILAAAYQRDGDDLEAEAALLRALDRDRTHAEALHVLGRLMLDRGDLREALRYLERVASLDAANNRYLLSLARAQYEFREYYRCEATAESVLRRDPRNAEALVLRGLAMLGLDRASLARGDLERVAEVLPRHPDALWGMGEAARQLGDDESMRGWWDRFLAEAPDDPRAPSVRSALENAEEPAPETPEA